MRQRFIQSFPTSQDIQTALDNKELGKPYVALSREEPSIDWNSKELTPPLSAQPLTFEILSAGTIMWTARNSGGGESKYLSYSINGGSWNTIYSSTAGTPINVEIGDEVRVKANGIEGSIMADMRSSFKGSTSYFNLRGNIASMLDENNYQNLTVFENCSRVNYLFQGTNVVDASKIILPFTDFRKNSAYSYLFADCKKLISAPEIPEAIFQDDQGQTSAIYYEMFRNCISLTRAPKLPTRTLCPYCYNYMFDGCTSLNYVECLADTTTGYRPFDDWLAGVSATGTFVKHPDATWPSGTSGIPTGWTIVDAEI